MSVVVGDGVICDAENIAGEYNNFLGSVFRTYGYLQPDFFFCTASSSPVTDVEISEEGVLSLLLNQYKRSKEKDASFQA